MKKIIALTLVVLGVTLTGCTTEETPTDLESQVTTLQSDLDTAETAIFTLETELDQAVADLSDAEAALTTAQLDLEAAQTANTTTQAELDAAEASILALQADKDILQAALDLQYEKLRNAFGRDSWVLRKVNYDPVTYAPSDAEYCFGVFDEDWSLIEASEFTHNGGLHFTVTVLSVEWGTELYLQDSCGNFSEFIYESSPYSIYSMPVGLLEEGKTYDVVLYKETYFTVPQLGFLPAADMGDFGAYPEDISAIIATEITE